VAEQRVLEQVQQEEVIQQVTQQVQVQQVQQILEAVVEVAETLHLQQEALAVQA
tara:strand:+ start:281 stop:442 length:162 start_codon:yes stop_codon:yes gene_type:complete